MAPQKAPSNEIVPLGKDKPQKADPNDIKPLDSNDLLKQRWHSLSHDQRQDALKSMSGDEINRLDDAVNLFGPRTGMSVSAQPQIFNDAAVMYIPGKAIPVFIPNKESVAAMKIKALDLMDSGARQLSNVLGMVGSHLGKVGGGIVGGIANPVGGEIPGAITGEITGAGIGGGIGEALTQGEEHLSGLDKYEDPEDKTWGARTKRIRNAALEQTVAQVVGLGIGKAMRPTLDRSLAKLYSAGGIDYGEGTGEGRLKTVIDDLMKTEKDSGKGVTVKDLIGVIGQTKDDVGKMSDAALSAPVNVGGKTVLLRDLAPNPTPLANLIKDFATKDEGLVKRASLAGTDHSVTAAKQYQQMIKDRALTFEQKPWTYGELARERIRINQELSDYYGLTKGEKQVFLKDHPLFEVDKAIADHIRDVTYPEMDKAAGFPKGTTAKLQEKRGILMQMDTEVRKKLNKLQNETVQAKGEGLVDKISPSGYLTSEGKPGGSLHRVQRLIHTPNGVASADKKVSQAFGHAPITKLRKIATTPRGSEVAGDNILALPARAIIGYHEETTKPKKPKETIPDSNEDVGPQSSAAKPKELLEKAKKLNPAAQGQVAYNHTAVNPATGHRIGSNDNGQTWYDHATGAQVA